MAVTLTRNLKLKVDSNLTANAKYNLERIDTLGATFIVDTNSALNIRSVTDINLLPQNNSVGGSGTGGVVSVGSASQPVTSFNVYATALNFTGTLGLKDSATGGNKQLNLTYKSDLNGSVDTSANRNLFIDVDGADRNLILGGNFNLQGNATIVGVGSNVTLPLSGVLATLSGVETLTNKTLNASLNTLTNISNSSIATGAAISYSKLNLLGGIVNSDINASAGIAYSKLSLSNGIVNGDINTAAAIEKSKLDLANSITNADVNSAAAISYSKLNLTGGIVNADISSLAEIARSKLAAGTPNRAIYNNGDGVLSEAASLPQTLGGTGVSGNATFPTSGVVTTDAGTSTLTNKSISGASNTLSNIAYSSLVLNNSISNADISTSAAIAYSKLNLTGNLVNADVSDAAGISGTKISADFGNQLIRTLDGLQFEEGGYTTTLRAAPGQTGDVEFYLPDSEGVDGQVLTTNGSGELRWIDVAGTGTVTSIALDAPAEFNVSGSPITTAGTLELAWATQAANRLFAGPTNGANAVPTFRALVAADLPSLTTDNITEGSNLYFTDLRAQDAVGASLVDSGRIDFTYTTGALTADIKADSITNGFIGTGISATKIADGSVSNAEFQYLGGVTSDLQTQLNGKESTITVLPISKGGTNSSAALTNSKVMVSVGGAIVESTISTTELGYLDNVTSDIQTQINDITTTGITTAQAANKVFAGPVSGADAAPTFRVLDADDVPSLPRDKLDVGTANLVLFNDGSGNISEDSDFTYNASSNLLTVPNLYCTTSIQIEDSGVGTEAISIVAPAALAASYSLTLPSDTGSSGYLLSTDGAGITSWIPAPSSVTPYKTDWGAADGTTKVVTHSLGSTDVIVQIFDVTNGDTIQVESTVRTDGNTVTLTASVAPAVTWRILILAI